MLPELLVVLVLILLNGVFALSEIAIVSSRRARLVQLIEGGSAGARAALQLTMEPTRFLSSVQVGITAIGILSGAIGEAVVASRVRPTLERIPVLAPYANELALGLMVIVLTYLSLILGELVPKRLALVHPERVASIIARPMQALAAAGRPLVYLLSVSTDAVLRVAGVRPQQQPAVSADEIRVLLAQGAQEGVFEPTEHELVTNVLNLDDRHVHAVLTPRADVVYLDLRDPIPTSRAKLRDDRHAALPLCDGGLDQVVGIVRTPRILAQMVESGSMDLAALAETALFVPETMSLMKLLEQFKRTHLPVALVVDEHGAVQGLVSLTDVVSAIVGDLPAEPGEDPSILRRDDGSWLLDGGLDVDVAAKAIGSGTLVAEQDRPHYHTLGGLAMGVLGRVPRTGDVFERLGFRFEIVDMDGNRVDRLLVSPAPRPPASGVRGPSAAE